jgi:hypothetical protein
VFCQTVLNIPIWCENMSLVTCGGGVWSMQCISPRN